MPVYDFAGNPAPLDTPRQRQPLPWAQVQQNYNWGNMPPVTPSNSNGGPIPFNFDKDWSGWRLNNWALQYDTLPWARDAIMFGRKMEPNRQNAIMSLIQALQNREGTATGFRRGQMSQAREQGRQLGRMLAAQGGGGGQAMMRGAMLDSMNRGADASSALDAYMQSPQGRQEALQAILQALSGAANPEALGAYQGITGTTLGVEDFNLRNDTGRKQSSGGVFGGILGTILGGAAQGAPWSKWLS